ncbi:MAG: hypothetical protein Q7S27_01875 [Nanoarchaeota archaeon]|nr:hypothetical protein [Nanoarchaeota archaeon]
MESKIIKEIIGEIKNSFRDEENLKSLTLVGSFYNINKKLEKFNDLDLVFIFSKITKNEINKLKSVASLINNKFSTENIGITNTLKIGPIKIPSKKKKTIMLHFLVYSKDGYKKYESTLTRFSFQHYKPLLGISLKNINHIKKVTKKDLFNGIDGIPAMNKWINKRKVEYLEPTEKRIKISSRIPSDKEYLEVIFYSILRLSSNILRLYNKEDNLNKKMCKEFSNLIDINLNQLPLKTLILKEKLRKGKNFSKEEIKDIKSLSLTFIKECEEFLNSR